jgi:hypothetical protein
MFDPDADNWRRKVVSINCVVGCILRSKWFHIISHHSSVMPLFSRPAGGPAKLSQCWFWGKEWLYGRVDFSHGGMITTGLMNGEMTVLSLVGGVVA